jgi:hypothetical protein
MAQELKSSLSAATRSRLQSNAARDRMFALDCLVEQAEFELRCGMEATLRLAVASQRISACLASTTFSGDDD